MRDTSLDEFIGGAGSNGEDSEDDANDEDIDDEVDAEETDNVNGDGETDDVDSDRADAGDGEAAEADAIQPAVSTSDWRPDGARCVECEGVVERRWRDDGDLVCADCKDW